MIPGENFSGQEVFVAHLPALSLRGGVPGNITWHIQSLQQAVFREAVKTFMCVRAIMELGCNLRMFFAGDFIENQHNCVSESVWLTFVKVLSLLSGCFICFNLVGLELFFTSILK